MQYILVVEPDTFLIVELGAGLRAFRDVESLYQLLQREQFLLGAGVPSQQRQEVDDRFGEVALLAESVAHLARLGVVPLQREHGETKPVAVALRELALAVGFQQQRQVGKLRHGVLPSEGLVEQHVEWGRGKPFLAADDVGDFHEMVVNDVGQMIGGQLVGTLEEHLVVEYLALDDHLAADEVVHVDFLSRLHQEAHHILLAVLYKLVDLLLRHGERVAHHAAGRGVVLEILYLVALGLQFLGGVEGDVCLAGLEQLVYVFLIDVAALALPVWSVLAAERHTLVELDAKPAERFDDIILGSGNKTIAVGVLDAEHQVAVVLAGEQVIIQGCTHASNVQSTRRTGCKTHSNSSF